jgi:hypothetical protein
MLGHPAPESDMTEQTVVVRRTVSAAKAGVSFGSALAMVISYAANKSILWAIVHGFLSWLYVIYYVIRY